MVRNDGKLVIMKKHTLLIITIILQTCFSPVVVHSQTGEYFNNGITVDGMLRGYRLYVPGGYNGVDVLPTVFVFHGFGGSALTTPDGLKLYDIADGHVFYYISTGSDL